jgi:hypothetical protein
MTQTILFLDIDGVLSICDPTIPMQQVGGIHCWPIPLANELLRIIDADSRLHPIWLSAWGDGAHTWNERAGTRRWSVGYHLDDRAEARSRRMFPRMYQDNADEKLIAVHYHLYPFENNPEIPVVWIEDGFMPETIQWAKTRGNVRLIDTTDPAIRDLLIGRSPDSVEAFMDQHIIAKSRV